MITLNVIYTLDTAVALSRFALTLLRWSDCRVRLIANGCNAAEQAHLHALSTQHPRLDFLDLSSPKMLAHGQALEILHDLTDEAYFAFADSDLFAVGPFMPNPLSAELTYFLPSAVIWDQEKEAIQPHRHRMGGTYFAIYNNEYLRNLRRKGLSLNKAVWEDLPSIWQSQLHTIGYVQPRYDTCKLLNAFLMLDGGHITKADPNNLRHLGGISRAQTLQKRGPYAWLVELIKYRRLPRKDHPFRRTKIQAAHYFSALLLALQAGQPLPSLPRFDDSYVQKKVERVTAEIVQLYADHQ